MLARPVILAVAIAPVAGCWTDIPYDSAADGDRAGTQIASQAGPQPSEERPDADPFSNPAADPGTDEAIAEELFSDVEMTFPPAEQPEPLAVDQEVDAPTIAPAPVATAEPVEEESMVDEEEVEPVGEFSTFEELFGMPAATAKAEPAPNSAQSDSQVQSGSTEPALDIDATTKGEGEPTIAETPNDPPLWWVEPRPRDVDPTRGDGPAMIDIESSTDVVPAKELDSRQLTWQLASRLSYVGLAPDVELSDVADELKAVADVLEIELPDLPSPDTEAKDDRVRQLLAVGRELGKRIGDKYGPDHAALVEVAFKSNLLMAVAESRPHLKHSISSSVGAAAVRAGLPESIWEPWQECIAASGTPDEIATAVVELHNQLGSYFDNMAASDDLDEPPFLR